MHITNKTEIQVTDYSLRLIIYYSFYLKQSLALAFKQIIIWIEDHLESLCDDSTG